MEPSERPTRHRIEIKLTSEEKALIEKAAEKQGKGISAFVRNAATNAAEATLSK